MVSARRHPRPSSRTLAHVVLALLLLFAQQQAVVHLLGHGLSQLAKQDRQEAPDPGEPACAKCLALAHLDHAVSTVPPSIAFEAVRFPAVAHVPAPAIVVPFVAHYRSRAPPVLA